MATILIVDDSILMRRNLKTLFAEAGHTVVGEASDGMEAYREYARLKPDLVTMDITMPVMNGIDAVKKIIASHPEAKIIMVSALDQRSMIFEAVQNGAKHYILKPITVEKVLHTVREVLGSSSAETHQEEQRQLAQQSDAADEEMPPGPFVIDNKNGIFVVSIYRTFDAAALQSLDAAVGGFVFVKPLKVIFNFGRLEALDDALYVGIEGCMRRIRDAGGTARVCSTSLSYIQTLKSRDISLFGGKVFTDLNQIVL